MPSKAGAISGFAFCTGASKAAIRQALAFVEKAEKYMVDYQVERTIQAASRAIARNARKVAQTLTQSQIEALAAKQEAIERQAQELLAARCEMAH